MLLALACASAPLDDSGKDDTATDITETGETGESGDTGETTTTAIDDEAAAQAVREAAEDDLGGSSASGMQICVWRDGEVVFSEGIGWADEASTVPVTPTTLFQIGSDTKKLTAITLLQAVDRGELSLDETVAEAIPGLSLVKSPDWAATTTLHHLLSHQGGLYDYTPWEDAPADTELRDRAFGLFAENEWAMIPSGVAWNYSNPNFSIAGLAVEQATGRAYADVVNEDVLAPLGMTRSFARRDEALAAGEAADGHGYVFEGGGDPFDLLASPGDYVFTWVPPEAQAEDAFTRPAGMVWSTAEDQCKLGAFLLDGDPAVLSEGGRSALSTAYVPLYPDLEEQQYAYGLMILTGWQGGRKNWYPTPMWTHGGNTLSMTSAFYVLPEQRLVVSILSNGYGDDTSGAALAALTGFVDLPKAENLPTFFEEEDDPGRFAGVYADPWGLGTLDLTWDGTALTASMPELDAAGISYDPDVVVYAKDFLYLDIEGSPYDLAAYDGEDGNTTYLVNRVDAFTRVDTAEGPPARERRARAAPRGVVPSTW